MTFQFKIQLKNISKPPVWRRVLVPSQFSFQRFHLVIQEAFGWENYHFFQFSPGGFGSGPFIKEPFEDDDYEGFMDAGKTKINEIFKKEGQKFTYIYDFGDSWEHKITLEKITADKTILAEILKDPTNPEYEEMKEWLGLDDDEEWDADGFDLEETRAMVRIV